MHDRERQFVYDGPEPDGPIDVDAYACIACGAQLVASIDVHAGDAIVGLVDEGHWTERGFEVREPLPGMKVIVDVDGLRAGAASTTCSSCGTRQLALAAAGEWQPQRWIVVACGSVASPDQRA